MNFKPNKHELKNFEKLLAEKEKEKLTSRSIEINSCLKSYSLGTNSLKKM